MSDRPLRVTREQFESWPAIGVARSGRTIRSDMTAEDAEIVDAKWGAGVWWSDRAGVVSPIVDAIGGLLGYENDPFPEPFEKK